MLPTTTILLGLAFAALLGAAIGVERDLRRRPAGVRTSAFVCMASALFTILSVELAHRFGDPSATRIASNIVQGIGFLGAGAIPRANGGIWVTRRFNLKPRFMIFRCTTSQAENVAAEVQQFLAELKIKMLHFRVSMVGASSIVEFEADVNHRQEQVILARVIRPGVICEVVPQEGQHE